MNLKNLFKSNEWELISEVLREGKTSTWQDLAAKHNVKPQGTNKQKRTAANDIYRRFLRLVENNNLDLTVVKQTVNGNGDVLFETRRRIPESIPHSREGMVIEGITTNPHGGEWIRYKNPKQAVEESKTIESTVDKLFEKYLPLIDKKVTYAEYQKHVIHVQEPCTIFFGSENACRVTPDSRIAIVNMYDAHLDKLPIKSSCGVESTLEQNIESFLNTVDRIIGDLALVEGLKEIILPVGNDLFHTNGFNSQTKKGTQIEYYGSPEDSYYAICDAVIQMILKLAFLRPVRVIMVKGNHDEDKVTTLGFWLQRYFANMNNTMYRDVSVDFLRNQRKYIQFGQNLIGFAHGDKEKSKIAQLPLIMAQEAKEMWGNTTYRKMYLGDLHHGFEYQFLKAKDMPGVEVEYLRSVGTTDTWHEDFGWVGISKTAYLQVFDSEEGEINRMKFNIK